MPQEVYTFSSIAGNIVTKSVTCIHSAAKVLDGVERRAHVGQLFRPVGLCIGVYGLGV